MTKNDEIVIRTKAAIDALYADGRTTLMGEDELIAIIESVSPGAEGYGED